MSAVHPDAELLTLCVQLTAMQAEWQRLWEATSDEWCGMDQGPITEADEIWQAYNDNVWPGVHISEHLIENLRLDDIPGRLRFLRATTPEGVQAKAAAVLAMDNAASYGDLRNDGYELNLSVIRDAAGAVYRPVGKDASQAREGQGPSKAVGCG